MSFILDANKNQLTVRQREPVTSGSVNAYLVKFEFSEDWDGMEKTACFRSGAQVISTPLDNSGECEVPWEVIDPDDKGKKLFAGVYGSKDGDVILPTIWACLGEILEGVTFGQNARPPTPNLWEQKLAEKQDKLFGEPGQIAGFDEDGNLVAQDLPPLQGGEGEGGVTDHRRLSGRDAERQHPITSIDGLEKELNRIPEPVEALTNFDLEELLK